MQPALPAEQEVYKTPVPRLPPQRRFSKIRFQNDSTILLFCSECFQIESGLFRSHPSNDHAAIGVGTRCVAGKCALSHSLRSFPLVPERDGQLFRELIFFDCPDLLDRTFYKGLALDKISVCQRYDLGLIFRKVKTDLAPFAVVVCPIRVDCGGVFLSFFSCETSRNCRT